MEGCAEKSREPPIGGSFGGSGIGDAVLGVDAGEREDAKLNGVEFTDESSSCGLLPRGVFCWLDTGSGEPNEEKSCAHESGS